MSAVSGIVGLETLSGRSSAVVSVGIRVFGGMQFVTGYDYEISSRTSFSVAVFRRRPEFRTALDFLAVINTSLSPSVSSKWVLRAFLLDRPEIRLINGSVVVIC